MKPTNPVYVVDDDHGLRQSTRMMLEVLGWSTKAFDCSRTFLQAVGHLAAGIVLLDVRMPGLDGLGAQRCLQAQGITFPVVVMTGHGDIELAVLAMKQGATDFLEKPFRREQLLNALETASRRIDQRDWLVRHGEQARTQLNRLTPREREVLDGLAAGYPNKTIAYDLGISARTVEVHRAKIMDKLEARSFSEVLRISFAAEQAA